MWRKLKTTRVSTALSCSAGNYETSPTLSTGSHQDECSPQHCPRCLSTVSYADSGGGNRARVTGRRRGVSRLLLTDSFVGMFATSGGLQKQIDAAMEFIWKWKLSANVKRWMHMACGGNGVKEVYHNGNAERRSYQEWISKHILALSIRNTIIKIHEWRKRQKKKNPGRKVTSDTRKSASSDTYQNKNWEVLPIPSLQYAREL